MRRYARIGIAYYAIYDPAKYLSDEVLRVYERRGKTYARMDTFWLPALELGLTLWEGEFEKRRDIWLRWCDKEANILLTGAEAAEQERQRAEQERQRAERLAEQLRSLGVEPEL